MNCQRQEKKKAKTKEGTKEETKKKNRKEMSDKVFSETMKKKKKYKILLLKRVASLARFNIFVMTPRCSLFVPR